MLGRKYRLAQRRLRRTQIGLILAVVGPGIIAANADNDASGIYGYSLAGAQYGYGLLWVLILVTISLGVCQEMCARMGAVTGKGLADLIREEYGVKITFFAMTALLIANFATTVSELAGISAAAGSFTDNRVKIGGVIIAVSVIVWLMVTRGSYKRIERILLAASLIYLLYIASAFMAHPHWGDVAIQTVRPKRGIKYDGIYLFAVIQIIGTTITPWGQFYIQASVRDKGIRAEDYALTRADVLFGAFFTNFIAFFIVVCCGATLFHLGDNPSAVADKFGDAKQIAQALKPVAGALATTFFAVGLFNASCFGLITVPLSTAYAVTESLGWESGLGRRVREAPLFIGVFTLLIAASTLVVLAAPAKFMAILILLPNTVGAALLPIVLILMLRLINDKRIMGEYTNSRIFNLIAWTTTIALIILSGALIVYQFLPGHG